MRLNTFQKNGILQLSIVLFVILCLILLNQNLSFAPHNLKLDQKTTALLENQECEYDEWLQKRNSKKYYVNSLNDYTASLIGLNTQQIDLLLKHLKSGNLIFTENEFVTVTKASEKQQEQILPKLRYPKYKKHGYKPYKNYKNNNHKRTAINPDNSKIPSSKNFQKINLNTTTAVELENQLGLPKFIAKRIINYRKHLKGYQSIEQIEKVYDILPIHVNKIKERCIVD